MRKAILSLTLAALVSGCAPEKPKEEVLETPQTEAIQIPDTARTVVQRQMFEDMQKGGVTYSINRFGVDTHYANTILPVDYEYNWKGSETIDGVSVGIEGSIGSYMNPDRGKPTEAGLDISLYNYMPGDAEKLLGKYLPEGHSLFVIEGWSRKPTNEELERMLGSFEKYVAQEGEKMELHLTPEEMHTLRHAVEQLGSSRRQK